MAREASEDIMLQIPNPMGEEGSMTVPVPKGTQVCIFSLISAHRPQLSFQSR